ncbi:S-adenosyl-L-methionine-dependent methyltransferase [Coniochaeta sp. PMI_546]|nr:S-adenosyl-L-methionine-dependent methyltransferase [Coniochaeta sp. PMI_546]
MSLYHEAAAILSSSGSEGGSLKSRIYGNKDLKSPPAQLYALVFETCKWSHVLKEVIDASEILKHERKLTPVLSLLLVHDFLVAKQGIALPLSHGLRASVERHKARLNSEFTRARLRRKLPSIEALRDHVEAAARTGPVHPRWIRINTLKTTATDQLETTFKAFEPVPSVQDVVKSTGKSLCFDPHIPNLLAVSPGTDFTKTEAYKSGAIILQDKASCFPAYLLNPGPEDGDVIDTCAAPGNKTTHLAAIIQSRSTNSQKLFAFEKDKLRAKTLERMVKLAGSDAFTKIRQGQDFLKVNPEAEEYRHVGALLLDPSCSGSGIVGRDEMPELHLPEVPGSKPAKKQTPKDKKRKRKDDESQPKTLMVDDDGETTVVSSGKELEARIEALASFQLTLLLHAFKFPAAKKITYSTCSLYAGENEHVVQKALDSQVAKERGWRILKREKQVRGMRDWPVRGSLEACDGNQEVANACIRAYKDDEHCVMGFFVAAFVREPTAQLDEDGPYLRDDQGRIVRDPLGIPTLKTTGEKAVEPSEMFDSSSQVVIDPGRDGHPEGQDGDGPYLRDEKGRIIRDSNGMPTLKPAQPEKATPYNEDQDSADDEDDNDSWDGFDD